MTMLQECNLTFFLQWVFTFGQHSFFFRYNYKTRARDNKMQYMYGYRTLIVYYFTSTIKSGSCSDCPYWLEVSMTSSWHKALTFRGDKLSQRAVISNIAVLVLLQNVGYYVPDLLLHTEMIHFCHTFVEDVITVFQLLWLLVMRLLTGLHFCLTWTGVAFWQEKIHTFIWTVRCMWWFSAPHAALGTKLPVNQQTADFITLWTPVFKMRIHEPLPKIILFYMTSLSHFLSFLTYIALIHHPHS